MTDENSPLYYFLTSGAGKLKRFITEGGYATVICVHPISAILVTRLVKKYKIKLTTCSVSTDYTCCPIIPDSDLDFYFIPHEDLKDEFVECGIAREKLFASGIPIRQEFYSRIEKQEAKRLLGFPEDKRNILLMCGSMGCGPIKSLAASVSASLPDDVILTVLCGRNERLQQKISKMAWHNVNILGFTNEISLLMDSADLYLTKAGGLSTSEAAAKRMPMALINAVSGCESYNRKFFASRGCAVAVDSYDDFPAVVNDLLKNKEKLEMCADHLEKEFDRNAAEFIFNHLVGKGIPSAETI